MTSFSIGIDLGGTQIKAVAVDEAGQILAQERDETGDVAGEAAGAWRERVRGLVGKLQNQHGDMASIGLSAPGLAARDARSIAFMPGRLQGLEGFDWTDSLGASQPVRVLNDAHAALLGEVWQGAGRGVQDAFMLTLGTGVGGAIWSNGRLLRGTMGRAGHLGHICLDVAGTPDITRIPGSLEDAIGDCTLAQRSAGRFTATRALVEAHLGGDQAATEVWLDSIRALACGVASLINVLDPEIVVIGGGIASAGEALFEPLQQELDAVEWRPGGHQVKIVPAQLGDWAGALGAAHYGRTE